MSDVEEVRASVATHGVPFVVGGRVEALLQDLRASVPDWSAAQVLNNPRSAVDFGSCALHFGVEDRGDAPTVSVNGDKPGQTPYRTYGFNLWVVAAPVGISDSRNVAHAAYVKAKRLLREQLMRALLDEGVEVVNAGLREGAVQYHLENMDLPGALVLGQFSLDYRDRQP